MHVITRTEDELLTKADLKTILRISTGGLDSLRRDQALGFPKPINLGRRLLRWRKADIDEWLNGGLQKKSCFDNPQTLDTMSLSTL